ncbi:hypothetical protein Tco_0602572 [Tanacetum coccineum]
MADLQFVDQHNMVACLERTDANADFHEINTAHSQTVNDVKQIHATIDGKTVVISESSVRSDLYFNDEDDNAVFKEWDDRVVRATTTAASLDATQASGNITKTQSTSMSNDPLSQEIGLGPRSNEGRLQQDKLTYIVTTLSQKVEGLESDLKKTKKLYATAFKKLINRVKSLEDELKFQKSKSKRRRLTLVTSKDEEDLVAEDPFEHGRSLIEEMDLDAGISLVSSTFSTAAQVSTASTFVSTASPQRNAYTTANDLTLAETLMEIRKSAAKDKAERQRKVQVHQAAQGFADAEWDDVLARVVADEDFIQ